MKNTVLEVDVKEFFENVKKIEEFVSGKKVMPVMKANAYGTYLNQRLDVLNSFDIVAVANVKEALDLRKIGYEKEIFILNQPLIEDLEIIHKENLMIGLSEIEFLKKVNVPIRVHIELETGMNRTGVLKEKLVAFVEEIQKNDCVMVEGCYTHFSSADFDIEYTRKQMSLFQEGVTYLKQFFDLSYIHCSASSGLGYLDTISNYVRPGILLYGHLPSSDFKEISVKPITRLKTKIVYLKEVEENVSIGYSQKYMTKRKMKIGTIPVGYADGYSRGLSNKGYVVIKNQRCPVVGNICMDSCMIDVTDVDVCVGEDIYLWDNEEITVEEMAKMLDTISYEILCQISPRVSREFVIE